MNKTTTLIIARHGNTFLKGETPRRVGARSDLDLVPSGRIQAEMLGQYIRKQNLTPDHIIAGPLKRTVQTTVFAFPNKMFEIDERLREIDYGPDENIEESIVRERIGEDALKKWESDAIVPDGWQVDPEQITRDWHAIAQETLDKRHAQKTLIVTSNGTARFAPHITGDFNAFKSNHSIKLSTGAYGILMHDGSEWHVQEWNIKPKDQLKTA
jgi:probable phosphoglycerate mutase